MTRSDRELSAAFKSEAARIAVPPRARSPKRSSRWSVPAALVAGAVVVVASLTFGRAIGDLRERVPAATAPAESPADATPSISESTLSDRHGLIVDVRPPVLRTETDPHPIIELGGDVFHGAVSPDGRKVAYWETHTSPTVRTLWLVDTSAPNRPRALLTLADGETATTSSGNAVVWSDDGSGLLISVNSLERAEQGGPPDAPPLYSALRQIDVAAGSVREVARNERGLWFAPVAWDRAQRISAAVEVGPGGLPVNYLVLRDGKAATREELPAETLVAHLRASPDGDRVLMTAFPHQPTVFVWSVGEPTQVKSLETDDESHVSAALWRSANEIVVSRSQAGEGSVAQWLEIWTLDGTRRVVLSERHILYAVRPDGTAAITDKGVVDLGNGALTEIPGLTARVLACVLVR